MTETPFDAESEFDSQLDRLVQLGYPALAGLTESAFRDLVAPLRARAVEGTAGLPAPTDARVPFLLVITRDLIGVPERVELTTLAGKRKPGVIDRNYAEDDLPRFDPIKELEVPAGPAYLLFDVDRGEEYRNLAPAMAMEGITAQGRLPLSIDEGLAFITLHPAALASNRCFSLVGSRCGDKRVPALWISQGAPKLGWCWYGNPHTWLGSASARPERVGLE
ncbi:hypothetical protein GAR06_00749 [Micromonospora saelicesensis]|uniref:Uncharacterized protein n=1 Tax=Micromonospora saelicesensis TaxID=285676 RepID=A0ABX9CH99_9ACTN|nr:DUF5701 family protein [Micromonospora saelicesensis]RAN97274.1 hypothetical protein GAR05_03774 [Micromonospora saelicesensis]RAO49756.1 hypothetical protein GAR06_00749 [Micromonospora saelicesensis]